jgi:hypothetical protein
VEHRVGSSHHFKSPVESGAWPDQRTPGEIHSIAAEAQEPLNGTPDGGCDSDGSGLDDNEDTPPLQTNFDRLTVFHAAPLAYFNAETAMHHAIPLHDFGYETHAIQDSVNETEMIGETIGPRYANRDWDLRKFEHLFH